MDIYQNVNSKSKILAFFYVFRTVPFEIHLTL